MAKKIDITRVAGRERAQPRREPYWQTLSQGRFLGFRAIQGEAGTWVARCHNTGKVAANKYEFKALGDFGSLPANERFSAAKKVAETWCDHVQSGGAAKASTVRQACEAYADGRADAAQRFKQFVYSDPIAAIQLDRLGVSHIHAWRKRLESIPAMVSRGKKGGVQTRVRSPSTINRDMVPFRAALNAAYVAGQVSTDLPWREALKPLKNAGKQRTLYLDRAQRKALLEHLCDEIRPFVAGLCALPLRPGALAGLRVQDFDARTRVLIIPADKGGKSRSVELPPETALALQAQTKDKLPLTFLFTQANGRPWIKDDWKGPIKDGVRAAKLPDEASAYTLRHSTITDLVVAGVPLLAIAQIAGTSARMIELHYGHLRQEQATQALATLRL